MIAQSFSICVAVATLLTATTLFAQSTRPVPQSRPISETSLWQRQVSALAEALASGPREAASALLDDAPLQDVSTKAPATLVELMDRVGGRAPIAALAYSAIPKIMASDIAAAVKQQGERLPKSVARQMVPTDGSESKANAAAAEWIRVALAPQAGELVGVILYWEGDKGDDAAGAPFFVLVKATQAGEAFHINHALFGDPTPRQP